MTISEGNTITLPSFVEQQVLNISNDTIFLSGGSFVKLPSGFDGDYNSLTNRPNLFSGSYNDLTDQPTIPAVPTNVSAFTNDAGYVTMNSIPTGLAGSNTGDIIYWDATTGTWIMMPAGSAGQVLTMENDVPVWANLPDHITMNLPPTVTTSVPIEVTQSSALCGGEVTSDGSVQLSACGVCWSTHHFPTIADAHTENDLSVSAFTSHVTGLAHHTTYYVRAYATNSIGTTYGAEMMFTTTDIPTGGVSMPAPCSADTGVTWHPILGNGNTLCAGTDSVELTLSNYQYGSIQWQYSTDTVSWFDISGAIDTLLVYKPEQTQFVRAAVSYANCPTEYSAVKLLQKAPLAYAGISRTVNMGDTVHLQANTEDGTTGNWQILQGSNGILATPMDAASKFYGADSLYRLRWTLTNSCGTSSDDISVRYVQTTVSDKVVVVDTTDIIFSDSAQMAQGYYVISFSDPNIVIGDSTILVSLINGGFLRRVESWEMANDSTYAMYTSQATLYDVFESGVFQLGAISGVNEVDTTVQNESPVQDVMFLDHIPTRAELRADPAMSRGNRVYIYRMDVEMPDGSRVNLMPDQNARGGVFDVTSNEVEFNQVKWFGYKPNIKDGLSLENVDFTLKAKPTLEYDKDHRCVKFGLYNAQFSMSADLVYTISTSGELSIVDYDIMKGTMAFAIFDIPFTLEYGINFDIKGTLEVTETVRHTFTANATYTKGVRYYRDGDRFELDEHQSGSTDVTVTSNTSGSADLSTSLSAFLNLKLAGLAGPRVKGGYKAKIKYCSSLNTDAPNGWQGKITSELFVKVDLKGAKIIDPLLPDWNKEWPFLHKERTYPYTIFRYGGNSQIINATGPLASPIKVIVKGSGGKTIRNVPVYFRPKDGGSVSDSLVYTNQQGVAQTLWTPGEICGEHQLHAFIYDCEQHPIGGSPLVFNAYESADCANSTLDLHYNVSGSVLSLVATGGISPYTYSVNGSEFANLSNLPVLSATGHYVLSVKDAHGCSYSITYGNSATSTCDWSDLDLTVETHNGTLTLVATGGTPPLSVLDGGNCLLRNQHVHFAACGR